MLERLEHAERMGSTGIMLPPEPVRAMYAALEALDLVLDFSQPATGRVEIEDPTTFNHGMALAQRALAAARGSQEVGQ
jgi:hypothetical protein